MFERYIRIDDKTFSFVELAKLVGIDNDNPMVSLVQEVYDGVLEASSDINDSGPNPGIEILRYPQNARQVPSLLARSEQYDEDEPIRTFLFGQHNSYIAYAEVQEKPCSDKVVVSGDMSNVVQIFSECEAHTQYCGEPNKDARYGWWNKLPDNEWECSYCGAISYAAKGSRLPQCPHCHARMGGGSR